MQSHMLCHNWSGRLEKRTSDTLLPKQARYRYAPPKKRPQGLSPIATPLRISLWNGMRRKRRAFSKIGKMPISHLEIPDILGVVKPMELEGHTTTAKYVLQNIGQIFRYAVLTGRPSITLPPIFRGHCRPSRRSTTPPSRIKQRGWRAAPQDRRIRGLLPLRNAYCGWRLFSSQARTNC